MKNDSFLYFQCKMDAESSATAVQQPRTSGTENSFPPIPSNSVKFYHTWINLKTVEDKYQYLQVSIGDPAFWAIGHY